jgi:hypothetical protein
MRWRLTLCMLGVAEPHAVGRTFLRKTAALSGALDPKRGDSCCEEEVLAGSGRNAFRLTAKANSHRHPSGDPA